MSRDRNKVDNKLSKFFSQVEKKIMLPSVVLGSSPRVEPPFAVVAPQSSHGAPLPELVETRIFRDTPTSLFLMNK